MSIFYEVTITLADVATAAEWLGWMQSEHVPAVLRAGATSARLIRLDDLPHTFVAQYDFESRADFDAYVAEHQPRLREESMRRFPSPLATYTRRTGEILG